MGAACPLTLSGGDSFEIVSGTVVPVTLHPP